MLEFSKLLVGATADTAVANFSGAMVAETISKHGRSSKSHKSRGNIIRKACFALLTASIIVLSINSCTGINQSSGSKSERWEYTVLHFNHNSKYRTLGYQNNWFDGGEEMIQRLGQEGWELVSVGSTGSGADSFNDRLYFKRRLP